MGTPIMILTGGDPVNRPDLFDLIRHGKSRGPAHGHDPRRDRLPHAGARLASSRPRASTRWRSASTSRARSSTTRFAACPGAFAKTMQAVEWAHEAGLPLQVNTTVCGDTAPYLEEMADFVQGLGIVFWEVFFLVPDGAGQRPHRALRLASASGSSR